MEPSQRASVGKPGEVVQGAQRDLSDEAGEISAAKSGSAKADVAQLAERVLGKDEVTSSILVVGSKLGRRGVRG